MVSINPENVIKSSESVLKKKAFGGVSLESAKEAIQKTAEGVKQLADNAIGVVQQELQNFKGKSAQEMAEMTSKKDAVILGKDKQIAQKDEQLNIIQKALNTAKSIKEGKPKKLKNGNVETSKVNKNGAKMTTEKTADGKLVKVSVETLDGDVRTTRYNLETGKPKSTYTNINEETTLKYDNDGKLKSKDLVNVKKSSIQKPKLISDEVIASDRSTGIDKIKKTYSDGSYEMVDYNTVAQTPVVSQKFNNEDKLVEKASTILDVSRKPVLTKTEKFNPVTGLKTEVTEERVNTGTKVKYLYNENGKLYKNEEKTQQGLKRIITAKTDKYGNVDDSNPSLKYIYPKNSLIKSSTIDFEARFYANKETLKMKDGSTVTLGIDGNYSPYKATINKQGEAPKNLNRDDTTRYLREIGKVGYNEDRDYFSNVLQ